MGAIYAQNVSDAANFLLVFLARAEQKCVEYSYFYDGTEDRAKDLREWLGLSAVTADGVAEHTLDVAIFQLEEEGLISKYTLRYKLSDDEPDFLIVLTEMGSDFVARKKQFIGRTME